MFPEGKRSTTGWMEPRLREGAARLAYETGAPLVPATHHRGLPGLAPLPGAARARPASACASTSPSTPRPFRALPEAAGDRGPARRAAPTGGAHPHARSQGRPARERALRQARPLAALARGRCPPFGLVPARVLEDPLAGGWWLPPTPTSPTCSRTCCSCPARRLTKWIRNASPVYFPLFYGRHVLSPLGLPDVPPRRRFVAIVSGAFFPYFYARGRVREVHPGHGARLPARASGPCSRPSDRWAPTWRSPSSPRPTRWERRSVYWRYAVPVLLLYAVAVTACFWAGT